MLVSQPMKYLQFLILTGLTPTRWSEGRRKNKIRCKQEKMMVAPTRQDCCQVSSE